MSKNEMSDDMLVALTNFGEVDGDYVRASAQAQLQQLNEDEKRARKRLKKAQALKAAQRAYDPNSKYHSRFFFKLTRSTEEEMRIREKGLKKKELVHEDADLTKLSAKYKRKLAKRLDPYIAQVRNYLLTELGLRTMGAQAGADQAQEIIQRALGSPVEPTTLIQFDHMMKVAAKLNMANFISDYMKIPKANPQSPTGALVDGIKPASATFSSELVDAILNPPVERPEGHVKASPPNQPQVPDTNYMAEQRKPRHIRNRETRSRDYTRELERELHDLRKQYDQDT
ncbi:hypothetical protein [Burkholderia phage BCSR5]|nr:hypothetical protein [Burkholderia phage BCSR5]